MALAKRNGFSKYIYIKLKLMLKKSTGHHDEQRSIVYFSRSSI